MLNAARFDACAGLLGVLVLHSGVARADVATALAASSCAASQTAPKTARRPYTTRELLALHSTYQPYIVEAATRYQLPVALLQAVIRVESGFHRSALSRKAAAGLMQLMPFHVTRMGIDACDPRQSILAGAKLLRELANRWRGDLVLTLASYNAGSGAVAKYGGVPPFRETRRYVARVLRHYHAYRQGRMLRRR